jgi:positive regulator of sigma E activity
MFKRVLYLIRDFAIMLSVFFIVTLILQKIFSNPNLKINYIVLITIFIFHIIRTNSKEDEENED